MQNWCFPTEIQTALMHATLIKQLWYAIILHLRKSSPFHMIQKSWRWSKPMKKLYTFFKANIKLESKVYLLKIETLESDYLEQNPGSDIYWLQEAEEIFFFFLILEP